jgi:imidazolonepropionase-like amidohydrolase
MVVTTTFFTNATVIDGLGGVRERQHVSVEDNRITEVMPGTRTARDSADYVHDLDGRILMPGMIDTHLHFGGGDYDPDTENDPVGLASLRSVNAVRRSLLAGFTTIRSAGAPNDLDIDARNAINQGVIIGPRVLASGRGVTMTGGHMHFYAIEADGVDEVTKATRWLIKRGADSIKIFAISPGVATAGSDLDTPGFSVDEIRAAVTEARNARKLTQTHCHSLAGAKNAVKAGVHSIDHGVHLDEEVCTQMKESGIFLVPTFGPNYYYTVVRRAEAWRSARAEKTTKPRRASFQLALEMGVEIAMGSDLGAHSRMKNGENAVELSLMVDAGMKPEDAIVAATNSAARLLKLDSVLGSVQAGMLADLVVVNRNPIDDITALQSEISLVMKDGVIYKNDLQ